MPKVDWGNVVFMVVNGSRLEEFFLNRLPMPGEAVELVCTKITPGEITFQLRTRDGSETY